jgi:hypothetical protein
VHHVNPEGLVARFDSIDSIKSEDGVAVLKLGPSLHFVETALVSAHTYAAWAVQTFNDCCGLGFDEKLGQGALV